MPIDARIRYTRMVIEEAFLQLLREKPLAKATVTELCQRAQINRATFYKHYLDVPDLLEKMEEKLFDQIRGLYEENVSMKDRLLKLTRFMKNGMDKYMPLGGENGDADLAFKTLNRCLAWSLPMTRRECPGLNDCQLSMLHSAISFAMGGILSRWIQNGMEEAPEKIAALLYSFCAHVAQGVNEGRIEV